MACVTLKRRLDLSPLHDASVNQPSGPETGCAPLCKKRFLRPPFTASPGKSAACKETWRNPLAAWQKFERDLKPLTESSPFSSKHGNAALSRSDIVNGIYKQYRQMKRRQAVLEATAKSDATLIEEQVPSTSAMPGSSVVNNDTKNTSDQPLLTLKQVTLICQQLLKEQEDTLRAEYEGALLSKLSEQYETFVKFNQDQLKKLYESHAMSYVS